MLRKKDWFRLAPALAVVAIVVAAGIAHTQELSDAEKARLKKLDSGPKVVDVAKYPADVQAGYALMEKKCAKCHSPARPINTRFVLPGEWERYIKRMVYKPDSKMTDDDGKKIYRFLVYDASVRKADSLRVHLSLLPAEQRTAAIEKIKALNPAFEPAK
jgi:cytochrome c5